MSEHIPKSWAVAPVGELVTLTRGKKPVSVGSHDSCMTTPYVTIKVFETGVASDYCNPDGLPLCTEDDVLIVWDGARCGLVGKGVSGAIGSTLSKVEISGISRPYLYYFMQSQFHRLNSNPRGVGIPHVDPNVFSSTPFPLPPLAEQRRIVEEIEKQFTRLDAAVEALRAAQAKLKRYRASVLNAAVTGRLVPTEATLARAEGRSYEPASVLLERIARERAEQERNKPRRKRPESAPVDTSNLPPLPKGWAWTKLPYLGELNRGKSQHRPRNDPHLLGGPYPFVQTGDIKHSNGTITSHSQTYSESGLAQSRLWPSGTLCITIAANIAETGILAYPACFPDSVVGFICDGDFTTTRFMDIFFRTERERLEQFAPATAQKNINIRVLSSLAVPLPPLAEQHRIVAEVERRLSVVQQAEATIETNLKRAERLRQAVLKRAFEGRLVPQDPNDEPAAMLLERIRTEKAAAARDKPRKGPRGQRRLDGSREGR